MTSTTIVPWTMRRVVDRFKLRLRDVLEQTIKTKGGVSHAIIREAFLDWDGDASGKLNPRELVSKSSFCGGRLQKVSPPQRMLGLVFLLDGKQGSQKGRGSVEATVRQVASPPPSRTMSSLQILLFAKSPSFIKSPYRTSHREADSSLWLGNNVSTHLFLYLGYRVDFDVHQLFCPSGYTGVSDVRLNPAKKNAVAHVCQTSSGPQREDPHSTSPYVSPMSCVLVHRRHASGFESWMNCAQVKLDVPRHGW